MSLTNSQQAELLNKLKSLETQLYEEIKEARVQSRPVTLDQQSVGRVSRIDAIQQQQMHLAALRRLENRLVLVQSAQERINSDQFGICANCEETIAFERLLARPESNVCISCARKLS